jgi:hypothetical protein
VCVNRRLGQEEILNQQEEEEEGGDQADQPEEPSVSISIFFCPIISSVLGIHDVSARISTSDYLIRIRIRLLYSVTLKMSKK